MSRIGLPHENHCDCVAHRTPIQLSEEKGRPSWWVSALPILACAICPACVATYAKLFSLVGLSFGLSETEHFVALLAAISVSIVVSGWRSWRTGRAWPISVSVLGSGLLLFGHLNEGLHAMEWIGTLTLLIGGLWEHLRLRRAQPTPTRTFEVKAL